MFFSMNRIEGFLLQEGSGFLPQCPEVVDRIVIHKIAGKTETSAQSLTWSEGLAALTLDRGPS